MNEPGSIGIANSRGIETTVAGAAAAPEQAGCTCMCGLRGPRYRSFRFGTSRGGN